MQTKDWLKKFLNVRQLEKPLEKYPLYRYRMSDDEFTTLKTSLKTSVWLDINQVAKISGWNACFIIYAAEWWRREYNGEQWTWKKLFDSLGTVKPQAHYLIVELGLAYWQREVKRIDGRKRYLGTIALEGGLPLNQLNRNNDWLSRLFKHAIPKYLRLQGNDLSTAVNIIRDYPHLPTTYQNDETYAVLADMVYLVAKLKKDHQLGSKDNPIAYLDTVNPDWREPFPLPINHQAGRALLTDMIKAAVEKTDTRTPFRGRRLLTADGSVQLVFEFAATVELAKITPVDDFPFRVDVEIVSDTGKSYPIGVAYQQSDKAQLKMPRCTLKLNEDKVSQGYTLQFKHFSDVKADVPLIEAIEDSVPWTFIPDNDEWLLVGTASVRTRAKQARVLYEPSLMCDVEVSQIPTLSTKKLIETSGVIELRDSDNCFRIQTAQTQAAQRYYLQGKMLAFSSTPKTVYLGIPEIRRFDSETETSEKINKSLLARPVGSKSAWQPLTPAQQGVYELRLQDEQNNTLFRTGCVLLPADFQVTVQATKRRVIIEHCGQARLYCELAESIENGVCEFNAETPPSFVDITFDWQSMSETLTFSVPYPKRGGLLINANDDKLKSVSVDDLYGVRLRLIADNHHHQREITLEFKLNDDLLDTHDLYFRDVIKQTGAVIEIPVINYQQWIKELQAISHHADGVVRLTVYEQSGEVFRVDILRSVLISENKAREIQHVNSVKDIQNLNNALNIDDDKLRLLFIRQRLKQLCCDFAHTDWRYLNEQQNDQPLVENELWTAAILDNRVLVALVLKLDSNFMRQFVDELPMMWELIPITDWLVVFSRYKNYLAQIVDEADITDFLMRAIEKISVLNQSLVTVVQLLKQHLLCSTEQELGFMQTNSALSWLQAELKKEQQELITRHPNVNEGLNLLSTEFNLYRQYALLKPLWDTLCYDRDGYQINKMRIPVSLAPMILAHCCLTNLPPEWKNNNTILFKLRQLKAFDEPWFNTVFIWSLAYLSQQSDYSQTSQQETASMINFDENDLIPEIEQELALANQTTQNLATDVRSFKDIQEQLDLLAQENAALNERLEATVSVEKFNEVIKKRDDALRMLLGEVKKLHEKIREIRSEINAKADE